MRVGGILGLQEIATLFTIDEWLDNYKVMTSMNIVKYQAVYKSTIVLINSIFQKGMRAVYQKLKINLVWPKSGNFRCINIFVVDTSYI